MNYNSQNFLNLTTSKLKCLTDFIQLPPEILVRSRGKDALDLRQQDLPLSYPLGAGTPRARLANVRTHPGTAHEPGDWVTAPPRAADSEMAILRTAGHEAARCRKTPRPLSPGRPGPEAPLRSWSLLLVLLVAH
jgi:hypothetical protein